MKVWHIGGPLHGLVLEMDRISFDDTVKFALDRLPPERRDEFPLDVRLAQIRYEIHKFALSETDAEVLAREDRRHHLSYIIEVYVDTRLDLPMARQMLMELITLDYMRMNGEKI